MLHGGGWGGRRGIRWDVLEKQIPLDELRGQGDRQRGLVVGMPVLDDGRDDDPGGVHGSEADEP